MKFLILLSIIFSGIAQAGGVPFGEFDCSQKRGEFLISVLDTTPGIFLKVDLKVDNEENVLEGHGLVAKQTLADGSSIGRILMPGSNMEFFFDDKGQFGLSRDTLNCRKL